MYIIHIFIIYSHAGQNLAESYFCYFKNIKQEPACTNTIATYKKA